MREILVLLAVLVICTRSKPTPERKAELTAKIQQLPYDVCGKSDIFKQKLRGSKVTLGAYPWMAALGYTKYNDPGLHWYCAGNLVTDQFILTVALCLVYKNHERIKLVVVRLGDLDLNDQVEDGASPVDIEVEKNITHPAFSFDNLVNDIGLVKLKTRVRFDYTKKPICLPLPELFVTSFVGKSGAIIGWGNQDYEDRTTFLNEASVEIKDLESCRKNYTIVFQNTTMDERVFCASSPGADACQGDGGGPLMMYRKYRGKYRMFVLGLISYGYQCGLSSYPGVYTNISTFIPWIVDNLELLN